MFWKIGLFCTVCAVATLGEKDDKKWVWNDNTRTEKSLSKSPLVLDKSSARYEVFEGGDDHYRPSYTPNRPYGGFNGNRPYENRPNYQRPYKPHYSEERPGGLYGSGELGGNYGSGSIDDGYPSSGILTGPVPSWVKDGPYKNFDKCKCTEKFNCNSPGISYGHCDVGKQYCCYSSKKATSLGGPVPSRPVYSHENGVLVGPGGPHETYLGSGNRYPRPGNNYYEGHHQRPTSGFGLGGSSHRPYQSGNHGILVGPGGPYDRPYNSRPGLGGGYGSYERSGKSVSN